MTQPRLLDLFCGAGGAAMGYHRAGFEVVGVDIKPQPHYPFEFHQADAMTYPLEGFDVIHASPPCQDYSKSVRHLTGKNYYPRLIDDLRTRFDDLTIPWIIENVPGAPILHTPSLDGQFGLLLCGSMFGLRVRRHRLFASNIPLSRPMKDRNHHGMILNPYNSAARRRAGIQHNALTHFAKAMDIDWMRGTEIGEAIPPAYTEYIGKELLKVLAI